jgi:hypothetical protein
MDARLRAAAEKEGFTVDRYEQAYETTEEPVWFVIGYKDPEEEGQ